MRERAAPNGEAPSPAPALSALGADLLPLLLILGAVLATYAPALRAGFIWDDDGHVTRADLRSLHGLWRIWAEPGATQQYYPLLHSAFWLEHRLWGDSPLGYHLANVLLHAAAAFLLYRVLRRLALPGALLAATAFAVHPVCVESVAWISEEKNTLSAVFLLAATLAYLRFDGGRRAPWYILGLVLFSLALATKTVTATLPAALLVILWWKRARLSLRGDVLPLAPWLVLGAAAGLVTAWVERTYIGAQGAAFALSPADRILIAGRALWFYLAKVFWPADLVFIYPRWSIDSTAPWQYLYPAAAAASLGALYALRRRSRGPLAFALLFAGTLFPALGFINVFPFVYSFVADHFQYLAAAIALAAAAALLASAAARLPRGGRRGAVAAAGLVVALLAWLAQRQCAAYRDAQTLWTTTLARNPGCWMACENLGGVFMREGDLGLALAQFQRALEIKNDDDGALDEMGVAHLQQGKVDLALAEFQRALAIAPDRIETQVDLGVALLGKGRPQEAAAHFQEALKREPRNAKTLENLASAYAQEGRWDEEVAQLERAAEVEPDSPETLGRLGSALMRSGRLEGAVARFRRAVALGEDSSSAHLNLANALEKEGKDDGAVAEYRRALEISPGLAEAHNNLANVLFKLGSTEEAVTHFKAAVGADDGYAEAHYNLANALLQLGRTDEAIGHLQRAVEVRPDFAEARNNLANALLEAGRVPEAEAQFRAMLAREPANAEVNNGLGVALMEEGRTDEAIARYRQALEARPDFAAAHINLGNIFLQHGRVREAVESYRRALAIEPRNARVHNNLGIALLKAGLADEATAQFRTALEIEPGYAEARRNLSIVTGRGGAR